MDKARLSYGDRANNWKGDEDLFDPVVCSGWYGEWHNVTMCMKSVCDTLYSLLHMAKYAQK